MRTQLSEQMSKKVYMGTQLSWLEHTPDKREVGGSSPLVPTNASYDATIAVAIECRLTTAQKEREIHANVNLEKTYKIEYIKAKEQKD